jgi:large subunit ribosomal protein L21
MFAVIADGGRQYRVQPGDVLSVDYRAEAQDGDAVAFDQILVANAGGKSAIGQPVVAGATVEGKVVVALDKGEKLDIRKYRRRKNYRRHIGHRQRYTTIQITGINVPGLEVVEKPAEEPKA